MGPTAVVQLSGKRFQLYRHPVDGRVVAFANADDAFAFAISLEVAGGGSAATVQVSDDEPVHLLDPGVTAFDLNRQWEQAA